MDTYIELNRGSLFGTGINLIKRSWLLKSKRTSTLSLQSFPTNFGLHLLLRIHHEKDNKPSWPWHCPVNRNMLDEQFM